MSASFLAAAAQRAIDASCVVEVTRQKTASLSFLAAAEQRAIDAGIPPQRLPQPFASNSTGHDA